MNFMKLTTNVLGTKTSPFGISQILTQSKRFAKSDCENQKDKKKKKKKEPVMFLDEKGIKRIQELQQKHQCDDGKPIFLKNGFRDQLLYRLTIFLCFAGLFGQATFICPLMFK